MRFGDWSDDVGALRRFGRALARDEGFALDEAALSRLVDKLIRQTQVISVDSPSPRHSSTRVRVFARFIALHRRHVRREPESENDAAWLEAPSTRGGQGVALAVRGLPLEAREALLLVVLAGFTHFEAAEALDIPLVQLVERLERARERLAQATGVGGETRSTPVHAGTPYLRIIK